MIIAIDASRAISDQPTGTELYSARIILHLAKIDTNTTYYLYSPKKPTGDLANLPKNFVWKIVPFPKLWSQIRLPLALLADKPDVLFVPSHVIPFFCPVAKLVVTLHDVAYVVFPEAYSPFERWYQNFTARLAIDRAETIITPSEATKRDLIKVFQAVANQIVVIPHGFDPIHNNSTTSSTDTASLEPYFLTVGRLETRKNTGFLIRAFAKFKKDNPEAKDRLVLIGKPGYGYEAVEKIKNGLPLSTRQAIIETGYVSNTERLAYLKASTAFVFPSLYEGFGIPILEAMAAGTPVITSDVSANPEVADDAAILIDPTSVDDLAHNLALLATDELTRSEIVKKSIVRAKHFSWEKMAKQTYDVLMKVGGQTL